MRSLADGDQARAAVARAMEHFYGLPFSAFDRYVPYGTPAEVAARLVPYLQAGAQQLNITGCVPPGQDAIALAGQIKAELLS